MITGKGAAQNLEPQFQVESLVQLEGEMPFYRVSMMGWQLLSIGFDAVFRGMEAVDDYDYEPLPVLHPKRTRRHRAWVAEDLVGGHLVNKEMFDRFIGDMADPVIVCVNGFSDTILHAFLLFRNSKNNEYNALHIRQGSYYPEFMDKEQTHHYFTKDSKKVVAALSLTKLVSLYADGRLDLKLLRQIFQSRMSIKEMRYCIQNQNCMTFSMLAFAATNFDLEGFLNRVGLNTLQSPYHIIQALAQSEKNRPALHTPEHPNPGLVPQWLMELNQPRGWSEAGAVALVPR